MATALVTGANRGIGLELCRLLAERGDEVIAACRESSPELDALAGKGRVQVVTGVDVTSDTSVRRLVEQVDDREIDLLINNAGILSREGLDNLDFEAVRRQFEVNSLGPLRVTHALLPRLSRGAKVAIVTSRMGSIADNTSGGYYGYRMSKAAVNMAGVSLAHDLRERGVAVLIVHPGFVKTRMTHHMGNVEPSEAAAGILARIDELSLETSGAFRHADGSALPW